MSIVLTRPEVRHASSVEEAVGWLAELGAGAAPLAGGTWVMRAEQRGEPLTQTYVALGRVPELRAVTGTDPVVVGALTTHTALAGLAGPPALDALRQAAHHSAFPQVRNVATLGGNIGARGFVEADLVPALLALEARLVLAGPDGRATVDLTNYLADRDARPAGEIIVAAELPVATTRRSGYARLTVRGGGEYAIASVAISVDAAADGTVTDARVAVGSVEPLARRCPAAEAALRGAPLSAVTARAAGAAAAAECSPRSGLDAPGWYRTAVLPGLFERAATRAGHDVVTTEA
ncbi:FAD binding domain-containing protein [Pseudonocardia asaccharolytica]|uniref:Molybdopterin dehydrogenase n=1 Tax=Pseudonocardia asaccharolytica DSM 44247 = NBRC 16224 TaxID=1123024 RepID=A0A511D4M5_9PSEU|nr:FAD binding domain-containing protein [Pseudonocardia asaccharolytica]GEL19746.1 molybdopterin dehydrogenase [Pseudonocardia asaccharolytica DSM 44247 = NBRC 16224]